MKRRLVVIVCALATLSGSLLAQMAPPDEAIPYYEQPRRGLERRIPSGGSATLPTGTAIRFKLTHSLATDKNHAGDKFTAAVTESVVVSNYAAVPAGAHVIGRIERSQQTRRPLGHAVMRLRPEKLIMPDGRVYPIHANIVDSGNPKHVKVSEQGNISGPSISKNQKLETAALAGTGAVAGAIVAGPVGGVVGAAAGTGISAAHYMSKKRSMKLNAGTVLILELNSPVYLGGRTEMASYGR